MIFGGGHEKANPHDYHKGPKRGDKGREDSGGRKRIGKIYRTKGPKSTTLTKKEVHEDLSSAEMKVLYAIVKRSHFGDDSADIADFASIQVPPDEMETFIESFGKKIEDREWGTVYLGEDDKIYLSLNIEKEDFIKAYLRQNNFYL